MNFNKLIPVLFAFVACFFIHTSASAETDETRLVFVNSEPADIASSPVGDSLSIMSLDSLPAAADANAQVLAAILKSSPISTFISTRESTGATSGALYLVAALDLVSQGEQIAVRINNDTFPLSGLIERLNALFNALNPTERQIAFIEVADPDNLLPSVLDKLSNSVEASGLTMTVLMVRGDAEACSLQGGPLEYAILGGLADRKPFGNGDGQTTAVEATDWMSDALTRNSKRQAGCKGHYSLILRGDQAENEVVAQHAVAPLLPEMESAVRLEEFEALFLRSSEDPAPIGDYLATCAFCPHEKELTSRLQTISEKQRAFDLETSVWASIREDTAPERLKIYVEHCQLCSYKSEAEARISQIAASVAARLDEKARFEAIRTSRNLNDLREWREACTFCEFADEADSLIQSIMADGRLIAENEDLTKSIERRDIPKIESWLDECEVCEARDTATAALERLSAEAKAVVPCVRAAGLPQQGGPRLLASIDQTAARSLCQAVLSAHPDSPVATTMLGRVEQAAGNIPAASAAYATGVAAELPEAFGLAAYTSFSPGQTAAPDYARAETLALEGYERGDWLSGEVLTLLYLRELVEGKSAQDAYHIASAHAEDGNPVAQFFMGYFYNGGTAVEQSRELAANWFNKSVDQGYTHANSFLAEILEVGIDGETAETERAVDLYWKALLAGDETALKRLTDEIGERPKAVVRIVQTRLKEEGLFGGRVDGLPGPRTVNAVEQFASLQTGNENIGQ